MEASTYIHNHFNFPILQQQQTAHQLQTASLNNESGDIRFQQQAMAKE